MKKAMVGVTATVLSLTVMAAIVLTASLSQQILVQDKSK